MAFDDTVDDRTKACRISQKYDKEPLQIFGLFKGLSLLTIVFKKSVILISYYNNA